jgi:hypothetical protein
MTWEMRGNALVGSNNEQYDLSDEYWYVVPARIDYSRAKRERVRALEFAFVLHNARMARGLLISQENLAKGMDSDPKPMKRGAAADAEILLEKVRRENFPTRPSRLRCYFLNADRQTAEHRMHDILRGNKALVRCHAVLKGARFHHANCDLYERLEGRPEDTQLAVRYWETFNPATAEEANKLEILADSALFFPDWQTFPTISHQSLFEWSLDNPPTQTN